MAARAEVELGRYTLASALCIKANDMLSSHPDEYSRCIVLNVQSILSQRQGNLPEALSHLHLAAQSSTELTDDLKLLTLSNVSLALRHSNPRQSRLFAKVAKQLCYSLHFYSFYEKVLQKA
jgi:hypothetical protein